MMPLCNYCNDEYMIAGRLINCKHCTPEMKIVAAARHALEVMKQENWQVYSDEKGVVSGRIESALEALDLEGDCDGD